MGLHGPDRQWRFRTTDSSKVPGSWAHPQHEWAPGREGEGALELGEGGPSRLTPARPTWGGHGAQHRRQPSFLARPLQGCPSPW